MADLTVVLHGDSHEAQQSLHDAGAAAGHAHESFHELKEKLGELKESFTVGALAADAFEKVLETVKEGLAESWAEAAKAENAERQLAAAAGEMTKEFKEQAEAIATATARKAEDVEAMQTLLLRYGAAPDVIGKALVAAYDVAAQKGLEVNSVLQMMIRSAEANSESIGRLGVKYKTTGDFSENLANQIEVISGKFGGSAGIEAEGMTGRARAASNAIDEVKKSFGMLMGAFEEKVGVLSSVAMYFNTLAQSGSVMSASMAAGAMALSKAQVGLGLGTAQGPQAIPNVDGANPFAKPGGGGVDLDIGQLELSPTKKATDAAAKREDEYLHEYNKWQDALWTAARKAEDDDLKATTKHDDDMLKEKMRGADAELKAKEDAAKAWLDEQIKLDNLEFEELKQQTERAEQEMHKRENTWISIGERLASALIEGANKQLSKNSSSGGGGMQMADQMTLQIMGAIAQASGPMGAAIWGAWATMFNGVNGGAGGVTAPGGLSGSSIAGLLGGSGKTGQSAWENYGGSDPGEWNQYNPSGGGYSDPPLMSSHAGSWQRFHRGGWPGLYEDERPIITQRGERVLSVGEVARMGGPSSVDAAARGGGQTMNVYAWDSESMLDTFGRKGGRAMLNTVRIGRGPLRDMFGGS